MSDLHIGPSIPIIDTTERRGMRHKIGEIASFIGISLSVSGGLEFMDTTIPKPVAVITMLAGGALAASGYWLSPDFWHEPGEAKPEA